MKTREYFEKPVEFVFFQTSWIKREPSCFSSMSEMKTHSVLIKRRRIQVTFQKKKREKWKELQTSTNSMTFEHLILAPFLLPFHLSTLETLVSAAFTRKATKRRNENQKSEKSGREVK